jgi:hypothetical protein
MSFTKIVIACIQHARIKSFRKHSIKLPQVASEVCATGSLEVELVITSPLSSRHSDGMLDQMIVATIEPSSNRRNEIGC